jgi:adenosylcobinamide-GDP ribazoletransferase
MWKQLKNLLAFLTVLPVRMDMDCLTDSARSMYMFPLIGAFLGLLAGVVGWLFSWFLPLLVVGGLALGLLLLLTGLHHTDGLLDFGDAVMYHGSRERKIEIMHDQLTGAGAIGLGLMTYVISAFAFAEVARYSFLGLANGMLIPGLVLVELSAKLAMVVATRAGNPVHKGMNSPFMDALHRKGGNARLATALAISFVVAIPMFWFANVFVGVSVLLASVLAGLGMVGIAHRHFGGVTGDVLGATNELARLVAVIVLLAMLR